MTLAKQDSVNLVPSPDHMFGDKQTHPIALKPATSPSLQLNSSTFPFDLYPISEIYSVNMKQNLSRVKLIHNPHYTRSGLKSYVYLLRKYNFAPTLDGPFFIADSVVQQLGKPSLVSKFASSVGGRAHVKQHTLMKKDPSSGHTGQVSAEDQQNDSEYLCQVGVGTPAQTLTLDFDTGSSDLWVWSTKLSSNIQTQGKRAGHTIFNPSESSTWKNVSGSTWQISYGDQSSASGEVGTDVVTVGGLSIQNQAVEIADQISDQFVQSTGDGLLGLAWGSINTVQPKAVQTPVENMITQQDMYVLLRSQTPSLLTLLL